MEAEINNIKEILHTDPTLSESDIDYFKKYQKQLEDDLIEELILIKWEDEDDS